MKLMKLDEAGAAGAVDWRDKSTHKTLTCANHPTARYLTKNPWERGLHFIRPCDEAPVEGWPGSGLECPCPFSDLRVVVFDDPAEEAAWEDRKSRCGL